MKQQSNVHLQQKQSDRSDKSKLKIYYELTKPRLSILSVFTATAGYLIARPHFDPLLLLALVTGTALAAGSAGVLNQWIEREIDARMKRTRSRPIPSGEADPKETLIYGFTLGLVGCLLLWIGVHTLAALLALATLISYLLIYTPLKKKGPWSTEIGTIPGALPPLIGWTAAEGTITLLGWILFALLIAWQMPHFMAIAWLFREDYRQAGLPMLSVVDSSGRSVGRKSLIYSVLVLIISLLPWVLGYTTLFYGIAALGTGIYLLLKALRFWSKPDSDPAARKLFFASIIYLPITMIPLIIDRCLLNG